MRDVRSRWTAAFAISLLLLASAPGSGFAQTAQPWAVQSSGLLHGFAEGTFGVGPGLEVQLRRNFSAFSLGIGVDHSWNTESTDLADFSIRVLGVFSEPRYVFDLGSDRAAPYLSARVGLTRASFASDLTDLGSEVLVLTPVDEEWDPLINGGGGILVSVGRRINLDVGATVGMVASESNYVVRAGASFGIGG